MTERRSRPLSRRPEIYRLRPWYHDFESLGLRTDFESGLVGRARRLAEAVSERFGAGSDIEKGARHPVLSALRPGAPAHRVNQQVKEKAIRPLVEQALCELVLACEGRDLRCLDLFCADGYYSCWLAKNAPAARVFGLDLDAREVERARVAARALDLSNARFEVGDVFDGDVERVFGRAPAADASRAFDLVLCLGGLYHLDNPTELLDRMLDLGCSHLILQTVVSLRHQEPDYFARPAPGWRHGCRFSHARLERWLEDFGWKVLKQQRGELPGNRQPDDRGSSYFLCRPQR